MMVPVVVVVVVERLVLGQSSKEDEEELAIAVTVEATSQVPNEVVATLLGATFAGVLRWEVVPKL